MNYNIKKIGFSRKIAIIIGCLILFIYGIQIYNFLVYNAVLKSVFHYQDLLLLNVVCSVIANIIIGILFFSTFKHSYFKTSFIYLLILTIHSLLNLFFAVSYSTGLFLPTLAYFLIVIDAILPYIFVLSSLVLYILLYRSKITPRIILIFSFVGIVLLVLANLFNQYRISMNYSIYLINIFLLVWLIIKGFSQSKHFEKSTANI
ncbi:hypothetical protein RBH29_15325 [Herbivorax sp. ANBcel31]|uniref:hypothetical protein n=1 Tax=Herbivorax sp. ANBcel31 TaxID=3069754 RepID=UPI0027B35B99|nr:hypothetical protein [Herbivorax sp. ANBcel31]MDQ2087801.1 hypothetical protein [Herbivorax sp. ANBcel31]